MPGDLPEVRRLADLTDLSREHLTLFVCGPGFGESVVVALPDRGWLVVDGANAGAVSAAKAVLDRFRQQGEPIDAVVLTHPHADHYAGMVELFDDARHGPAIQKIGCVAEYLDGTAESSLHREVRDAEGRAARQRNPSQYKASGAARALFERIRTEWEDQPDRRLRLTAKQSLPLTSKQARARVLSPSSDDVVSFFDAPSLSQRLQKRANELSTALELTFGTCRLILGADLPDTSNDVSVPSGWSAIAERAEEDLREHKVLKVPHHASKEAVPDSLLGRTDATPARRAWVVTPYNKGHKLPSFGEGGGSECLLRHEPSFLLSALPRGWKQQRPLPPQLRPNEIKEDRVDVPGLEGLGTTRALTPEGFSSPLECAWAATVDDRGQVVALFRGPAATEVVR